MLYLLDKNVVRHAIKGFRDGLKRRLLPLELGALTFWQLAQRRQARIFISEASFNVPQQRLHYNEAIIFLNSVEVLTPTRYHTRWARRIRETAKLTREDAAMIALATFGTNSSHTILGMDRLITYDLAMINGYLNYQSRLSARLQAMTNQLDPPFSNATLPQLMTPDDVLNEWA